MGLSRELKRGLIQALQSHDVFRSRARAMTFLQTALDEGAERSAFIAALPLDGGAGALVQHVVAQAEGRTDGGSTSYLELILEELVALESLSDVQREVVDDALQAVRSPSYRVVDKAKGDVSSPNFISDDHRSKSERLDALLFESHLPETSDEKRRSLQVEILTLKRSLRDGPQLVPGADLGQRYRLIRRLGHGGFATVWQAIDRQLGVPVAVKVLHGQFNRSEDRVKRFFRGARIMSRLNHPNIVRVLQPHGEDDGYKFFVMEWLEGGDLLARLGAGDLANDEILDLITQVAGGLAHAHATDPPIIHRDVKPANILLTKEGVPKLSDFDLVRAGDTTGGTHTGALGTFFFAAPECLNKAKEADPRADVYGLAMTAIVALSPTPPPMEAKFQPDDLVETLPVSAAVRALLRRSVSVACGGRPRDAKALKEALQRARAEEPAQVEPEVAAQAQGNRAVETIPGTSVAEAADTVPGLPLVEPVEEVPGPPLVATTETVPGPPLVATTETVPGPPVVETAEIPGPPVVEAAETVIVRPSPITSVPWAIETGEDERGRWALVGLDSATFRMRYISAGTFQMGSPDGEEGRYDDEDPQHEVTQSQDFWLAEHPVTQAVWAAVMLDNPSRIEDPTRPVENVSWEDAVSFIEKANETASGLQLKLPTEAQWEYACRAGTTTARYGELDTVAWYEGNSGGRTHPVGQKASNPWGLYDMLGNVWEWCHDGRRAYDSGHAEDPIGPERGTPRVLRGGSWHNSARYVRAAYRSRVVPSFRYPYYGFRLSRGHSAPSK